MQPARRRCPWRLNRLAVCRSSTALITLDVMRKSLFLLAFSLFVMLLLGLAVEGAASVWTKWQAAGLPPPVREVLHCEYDPDLGWRHMANKHAADIYGPGISLRTNGQHMRGVRDHAFEDSAGTYRVLCLGDSFTMGYGVNDDETYPALLAKQHPSIETINMGLGGYGVDQCYLWYERDGTKFDVDVLLFALIVGDFFRMNPDGNVANIPKPVMQLVDGMPVAINTPVTNILAAPDVMTRLARVWQTSSFYALVPKSFAAPPAATGSVDQHYFAPIALRIFEVLRDRSRQRGQLFVIALLPVFEDIPQPKLALIDDWLRPALAERGIPFVDLRPAFRAVLASSLPEHFAQGHYSQQGNLVAARALHAALQGLDPECPR